MTSTVTFRNTELVAGLAVLGGVMGLLLLALAVVAEVSFAVRVGAGALGLASTWLYVGRLARASVRASDEGLVIRNPLRTVRVGWQEIETFQIRPGMAGVLSRVALRDGRTVSMWAVQSPRRRLRQPDETAVRAVAQLNRLLDDRHLGES